MVVTFVLLHIGDSAVLATETGAVRLSSCQPSFPATAPRQQPFCQDRACSPTLCCAIIFLVKFRRKQNFLYSFIKSRATKGLKYHLKIRAGKTLRRVSTWPALLLSYLPGPEGDRARDFCQRGWKFPSEGPEAPGSCVLVFLAAGAKKGDRAWALAGSPALDGRATAPTLLSLADLRVNRGASLVVQWLGIQCQPRGHRFNLVARRN